MTTQVETTCCVVGGGPAGLMLGYLLARAGIDVTVLEKHSDFLRDFRGDTVHPSTLELMYELGILDEFLELPHSKLLRASTLIGDEEIKLVDFAHLRTHAKYIALMPQWDFLDFIAQKAKQYDAFNLMLDTEATGIIEENGKITGVNAATNDGDIEIHSHLVVAADGRGSIIREAAGFEVKDIGAPMDVLWLKISRKESDPRETLGRINQGSFLITLNRGDYWQCGMIIPKGHFDSYKEKGLDSFKAIIVQNAPFFADRVSEIDSWEKVKLLTVKVDRLRKWYRDGLLCIGDSAHAMSPVAGVGVNLAIQDAVATANILWKPLNEKRCTEAHLQEVQKRRIYPARMTQRMQVAIQNNVIKRLLKIEGKPSAPMPVKAFNRFPILRRIPAAFIGIGFRPEHIHAPERKEVPVG